MKNCCASSSARTTSPADAVGPGGAPTESSAASRGPVTGRVTDGTGTSPAANARPAALVIRSHAAATVLAAGARGSDPAQLVTNGNLNKEVSNPSRSAIRKATDSPSTCPASPGRG